MKFFLLLMYFSFPICTVYSQNCNLSLKGKVLDATSGLPVADVMVYIGELQKGDHSNDKGEFLISGLCEGNYTLMAKHLNHEEKVERIHIRDQDNTKIIYLTCHTDTLHNIIVKGAKLHWEDITVLNRIQEKELFLSSGLSLGKALEKINGVYNLSTGSNINKPVIRGLHSNRVLILNNEIRQEGQQWGNEHAPEIDAFIAKNIEVVKGAQTIRYGSDVIGGVILVRPKPLKEIEGILAEFNSALMSNGRSLAASALVEGRAAKWRGFAWRLQGSWKQSGNNKAPGYFLKNTGMKELNYSAAAGYAGRKINVELFYSNFNTKLGIFSGSHIGNLSDLYQAFHANEPIDSSGFNYRLVMPYQQVNHQLIKINSSCLFHSVGLVKLLYGYQQNIRKEYDKNIAALQPDGTYNPSLHFVLNTHSYDLSLEHKPLGKWIGAIGINALSQSNTYQGGYFIPNFYKNTAGIYLIEKWHRNRFSMEAGLRYDLNDFTIKKWEQNTLLIKAYHYQGVAASAAFRYQLPYITIHLNMGTTWRAPYVNELYSNGVHHSAATFEMGDPDLNAERSYNTSLTLDFNYRNTIDAECTFYNNYISNFINLAPVLPAVLSIRGAFPAFQYMQSNINMSGVEFSATKKITHYAYWHVKTNLLLARDLRNNKFVYGMPPARVESDLDLTLWEKGVKNLHLSITGSFTAKQHRAESQDDYVPPPDAYFLVHTDLISLLKMGRQTVKINLGANNLLNTPYRDFLDRNRYFADEAGRNIYIRFSIPVQISK